MSVKAENVLTGKVSTLPVVDKTLTRAGYSADAKATGDAIAENKQRIESEAARLDSELDVERGKIDQIANNQIPVEYLEAAVDAYVEENSAGFATQASLDAVEGELKSDLSNLSYYRRYTAEGFYRSDFSVPTGSTIYFRPVNLPSTLKGISLLGLYGDSDSDGYDTLCASVTDETSVTTEREYKKIQVITVPYQGVNFTFDFWQDTDKEILVDRLSLESEVNKTKSELMNVLGGMNRYNSTGLFISDFSLNAGYNLTLRLLSLENANSVGITVYGLYGDTDSDGYDLLLSIRNANKNYTVNAMRDYKRLQIVTAPYGSGGFTFECSISETSSVLSELATVENVLERLITSKSTCRIFKKVVCCGDSYTSGHIHLNGSTADGTNEDYSWVHYMGAITGNEWVNCGSSGANVWNWQTRGRGLPKAKSVGKAQAYIIGLMLNDVSETMGEPLGTMDDIGTENNTYYAGMSKLIRELNSISPNAKIFVNTCPKENDTIALYNEAVRNIVAYYKDVYPIHCIDLYEKRDLYKVNSLISDLVNGHYTAIGYEQFAEIYSYVLSEYINNHVSEFQDVYKIEYDAN